MKKWFIPALAMLAVTSCSKYDETNDPDNSVIRMRAGVTAPIVRSPIESDDAGILAAELAGVQFIRMDGATPNWADATAVSFTGTIGTDGAITPSATQFYPTDGSNANILGYYPAATSIAAGKASMTITGQEDVIYSAPVFGNKTVALQSLGFVHKLSQFSFVAVRTADVSADVTNVTVSVKNANTTFDMALADGTLSGFATPKTISVVTNGTATLAGSTATAGIMLEPTASLTLTVAADGFPSQDVTVSPDAGSFLAGYRYTITLSFGTTTVSGNATVGKWVDGTPIVKPIK